MPRLSPETIATGESPSRLPRTPRPFELSLPSVLLYLLLTFEALSPWNRSRPWRSSAAAVIPPTLAGAVRRRPDPAAIRQIHSSPAGAHNLAITVPSRCRRLPVLTASLTRIQGSFDIGLCFPFLGLGNDVPGSTRGARNVWYGRVFVRPGKLLSAFLALD